MQTISVREANQNFSYYLSLVERGEEFTVTKRGKQVARLMPAVIASAQNAAETAPVLRLAQAREKLDAMLAKFPSVNFGGPYSRDEAYD